MALPGLYDVNFCFPIKELKRARQTRSIYHRQPLEGCAPHPELFNYMPFGPWSSPSHFTTVFLEPLERDPSRVLFAIIDKTRTLTPEVLPRKLTLQVYYPTRIPPKISWSQRSASSSHITTNACALLLQYALDLPAFGGLGLRRVQWQASDENCASVGAAETMGFKFEGVLRWDRVSYTRG
ncbi:hypothetical protein BS17DRAFT_778510 [Gyrodon lividus]|nr:hypothetical protein BS17DRAFT_778510 [Gyrodon lividus]